MFDYNEFSEFDEEMTEDEFSDTETYDNVSDEYDFYDVETSDITDEINDAFDIDEEADFIDVEESDITDEEFDDDVFDVDEEDNFIDVEESDIVDEETEDEVSDLDDVTYIDGIADFSKVSKYEIDFENFDELYKTLGNEIRIGDLDSRKDLNNSIRNHWQALAKEELLEKINSDPDFSKDFSEKTGINTELRDGDGKMTLAEFDNELSEKHLTLHETADCQKMQFVPTEIHQAHYHSGGVSEMLERFLSGDIKLSVK